MMLFPIHFNCWYGGLKTHRRISCVNMLLRFSRQDLTFSICVVKSKCNINVLDFHINDFHHSVWYSNTCYMEIFDIQTPYVLSILSLLYQLYNLESIPNYMLTLPRVSLIATNTAITPSRKPIKIGFSCVKFKSLHVGKNKYHLTLMRSWWKRVLLLYLLCSVRNCKYSIQFFNFSAEGSEGYFSVCVLLLLFISKDPKSSSNHLVLFLLFTLKFVLLFMSRFINCNVVSVLSTEMRNISWINSFLAQFWQAESTPVTRTTFAWVERNAALL